MSIQKSLTGAVGSIIGAASNLEQQGEQKEEKARMVLVHEKNAQVRAEEHEQKMKDKEATNKANAKIASAQVEAYSNQLGILQGNQPGLEKRVRQLEQTKNIKGWSVPQKRGIAHDLEKAKEALSKNLMEQEAIKAQKSTWQARLDKYKGV